MFSYKKVGGIHFLRVFRLGFSFYIARKGSLAGKPVTTAAPVLQTANA